MSYCPQPDADENRRRTLKPEWGGGSRVIVFGLLAALVSLAGTPAEAVGADGDVETVGEATSAAHLAAESNGIVRRYAADRTYRDQRDFGDNGVLWGEQSWNTWDAREQTNGREEVEVREELDVREEADGREEVEVREEADVLEKVNGREEGEVREEADVRGAWDARGGRGEWDAREEADVRGAWDARGDWDDWVDPVGWDDWVDPVGWDDWVDPVGWDDWNARGVWDFCCVWGVWGVWDDCCAWDPHSDWGAFDERDTWGEWGTWSQDQDHDHAPGNEEPLAAFAIVGDQLDLTGSDPDTAATAQKIWGRFVELIPASQRQMVVRFELMSGEDSGFVYPLKEDPSKWVLGVTPRIQEDLDYVLIHEFGHLLTLKADEVPPGGNPDSCPTYFTGEGCAREGSTFARYMARFWPKDQLDLLERRGPDAVYRAHPSRFVTDYAATDPTEDLAEAFATFVFEDRRPTGRTIADQKVDFFWNDPDMVTLRNNIQMAL